MERLAVDRDVAVDRGDDDVAMKGDAPYRFRQIQRMGERGAVGHPPPRTVSSPPLAITGVPSRSTSTAIALATSISVFQRQHRGKVEAAELKDLPV
jgi:hypothetical protein